MTEFVAYRYEIMRSLARDTQCDRPVILDLGAGANPISATLTSRQQIRVDVRLDKHPTLVCDLAQTIPLADHTVDLVIAGEIIEHIVHSRRFLSEIHRVLVPGGSLLLSTPNVVSLKYRVAFVLGRIPAHAARADYTYGDGDPANRWGHVRDYSFAELRTVLQENGFRVTAERGTGLTWQGQVVLPAALLPLTLSDQIIMKARAD
jgi:SAM-dependent methyltransferase